MVRCDRQKLFLAFQIFALFIYILIVIISGLSLEINNGLLNPLFYKTTEDPVSFLAKFRNGFITVNIYLV